MVVVNLRQYRYDGRAGLPLDSDNIRPNDGGSTLSVCPSLVPSYAIPIILVLLLFGFPFRDISSATRKRLAVRVQLERNMRMRLKTVERARVHRMARLADNVAPAKATQVQPTPAWAI